MNAGGWVFCGAGSAVCQIFGRGAARRVVDLGQIAGRIVAARDDVKTPFFGRVGAKVGGEKSVRCLAVHAFPSFFGLGRIMGHWAGGGSTARSAGGGAPLRAARFSLHPVADSGTGILKTFWQKATPKPFLLRGSAPNLNFGSIGSGCGWKSRESAIRRVGVRLTFAVSLRISSVFGLSAPGLEDARLGGGGRHVN